LNHKIAELDSTIGSEMVTFIGTAGDKVAIGDILLVIADVDRAQVRIGIDASKDVPILRGELVDQSAGTTLPSASPEFDFQP
jgi:sRNA-binding carbon storage regulator CsrA